MTCRARSISSSSRLSRSWIPCSLPANPYDSASCESFIKTLKREEIYANKYRDLEDLHSHIEEFIDGYYNQKRLHSALVTKRQRNSKLKRTAKPRQNCNQQHCVFSRLIRREPKRRGTGRLRRRCFPKSLRVWRIKEMASVKKLNNQYDL